jgi:hypothetical protein
MLLVLCALSKMQGIRSKEEVLRHIRINKWMAPNPHDHETYENKNESKSDTLLCYARLDAVTRKLMFDHDEDDHWEITRMGQDFIEDEKRHFVSGVQKIYRCSMWTPKFKIIFDASYVPSAKDYVVASKGSLINEFLDMAE